MGAQRTPPEFRGPSPDVRLPAVLAARDPRDAALVGAGWSVISRGPLAMATGIALLAISAGASQVADPEKFMPTVLLDMPMGSAA